MIAFIADLHLQHEHSETTLQAISFLDWACENCSQLYILGDLFEYWLGDDCPLPGLDDFHSALSRLTGSGCTVTLMHGNRDFLLGDAYCKSVGAELIREDTVKVQLGQRPALLLHGDTLCTDDTSYQKARTLLRTTQWQQNFTSLPFDERIKQAQSLRKQSQDDTGEKSAEIMDVNAEASKALATRAKVSLLIHGHTHRPFWHKTENHDRVVVGDWHANGADVALYNNGKLSLKHWPFKR